MKNFLITADTSETAVYTTTDVAIICKVAPRTVAKWFDSGRLNGYTLPGSFARRIPQHCLTRFLQAHAMYSLWHDFLSDIDRVKAQAAEEAAEEVAEESKGSIGFRQPTLFSDAEIAAAKGE